MRQLAEGKLFTNFETIAAVFLFEKLQHMRLNIPKFESQEKKKLKKMEKAYRDHEAAVEAALVDA